MTGRIILNQTSIFSGSMVWNTLRFQSLVENKIGFDAPITNVFLDVTECPSLALNELLAVIDFNIWDDTLETLTINGLPKDCELDEVLLDSIASKSANLNELHLCCLKLNPQPMQALIKMMTQTLQSGAPTEMLSLFEFSDNEREGQQVLTALASSKINTLKELNLGQMP